MSLRSDYVAKWDNEPPGPNASQEQRDDWENLPDPAKGAIKNLVPIFQGLSEEQQDAFNNIVADIEAGSPADIEGLAKIIEDANITPQVKKFFFDTVGALLTGKNIPAFEKVFAEQKKALDVELGQQVRGITDEAARRGVLGSSSTAAGIGGAIGGYSQSIASLMSDIADRQQRARATQRTQGIQLGRLGFDIQQAGIENRFELEEFQNQLYLENIALQSGALDFQTNQQIMENNFNLGVGTQFGWDPTLGSEFIIPAAGTIVSAIEALG